MDSLAGQVINGYEIREKIGAGGYGAVYKAYQLAVDRDVAIKVILPEHASKPEFGQRFETEARLVAKLEHPHIVPLYDYWRDESGAYLVMRWLPTSLRATLLRQGPLSLVQTARLLDQIADALDVAHQAGVIHRDLKPDNILLDERGNAYLTDFGIAKRLDGTGSVTGSDQVVGTPAYYTPEQITVTPVTPQTDVYALGVMLYEMLAGKHPFANTPIMLLVVKHLQDPLPYIADARPDASAAIDEVIQRSTAKNPSDRYPNTVSIAYEFRLAAELMPGTAAANSSKSRSRTAETRKLAPPPEKRNRFTMLQNVRVFWIEGVLENSLHSAAPIEVSMRRSSQSVDSSWNAIIHKLNLPDETLPPDSRIIDVFDKMNGKLLVLGDPGSGKTTTMLELARDLLYRAESDDEHPIPVVFNLSSWGAKRIALTVWLVNELGNKYQVPHNVAQEWVDKDQLLLLLDGLDEVAPQHREVCIEAINDYRRDHGFVDVVVCSRIGDYEALTNRLKLNGAVILEPLSDRQIDNWLAQLGQELEVLRELLTQDETLREMGRSPLMLSIMVLAYQGVPLEQLPQFDSPVARRQQLFGLYVRSMAERRGMGNGYSVDRIVHYLTWLAQQMQKRTLNTVFIEKLGPSWLDTRPERRLYRAGVRVLELLILGIACLLVFLSLPFGLAAILIIVLACVILWQFTMNQSDNLREIPFFEALQWNWNWKRAGLGLVIGLAMVYVGAPIFGIVTGLGLAVILCLELRHGQSVATRTQANRPIRNAVMTALTVALAWGLVGGLATALSGGLIAGITGGLAWALVGGLLMGGGDSLVKYFVLNMSLWLGKHIPWDYSQFLDYAASLIFLRKVGGGYIFVHRYLLEYFAGLE